MAKKRTKLNYPPGHVETVEEYLARGGKITQVDHTANASYSVKLKMNSLGSYPVYADPKESKKQQRIYGKRFKVGERNQPLPDISLDGEG